MWNPFAGFVDKWRAHPFQQLASTAAGAFVPGGGYALGKGFDWYNNRQFDNAASQNYQHMQDVGSQMQQQSMQNTVAPLLLAMGGGVAPGGMDNGFGNVGSFDNYNGGNSFNQTQNWGQSSLLDFLGTPIQNQTLPGTFFSDPRYASQQTPGGAVAARQDGGGGGGGFQGGYMGDGFTGMSQGGDVHGMVIRGVQPGLGSGQKWFHGRSPGH